MKSNKSLIGAGLLTAIASSLCCITPVLALISGSSSMASSFSWLEPARPYLIGFTVLVLGYAWYQKLKPAKADDCGCAIDKKPSFLQSKLFLGIVTIFAVVMTLFPYYSDVFYPEHTQTTVVSDPKDVEEITINIEGMTCEACQNHVNHAINELPGIISVNTSYNKANTEVNFDKTKTNLNDIKQAINSTGYKAKN